MSRFGTLLFITALFTARAPSQHAQRITVVSDPQAMCTESAGEAYCKSVVKHCNDEFAPGQKFAGACDFTCGHCSLDRKRAILAERDRMQANRDATANPHEANPFRDAEPLYGKGPASVISGDGAGELKMELMSECAGPVDVKWVDQLDQKESLIMTLAPGATRRLEHSSTHQQRCPRKLLPSSFQVKSEHDTISAEHAVSSIDA